MVNRFHDGSGEIEGEGFLTHRPWGRTQHVSGHTGKSRQGEDREMACGHMSLLGTLSGVLWGFLANAKLINSN